MKFLSFYNEVPISCFEHKKICPFSYFTSVDIFTGCILCGIQKVSFEIQCKVFHSYTEWFIFHSDVKLLEFLDLRTFLNGI